ncbi:MAG TPA: SPOR domain-containing protein, partial [Phenylobacterium sp.]|nr:SPOR domain-containing protein [Phenylobacterium sp.]
PLVAWMKGETDLSPESVVAVGPLAVVAITRTQPMASPEGFEVTVRAEILDAKFAQKEQLASWGATMKLACADRTFSMGEVTGHAARNLRGEGRPIQTAAATWTPVTQGTIQGEIWKARCDKDFKAPLGSTSVKAPQPAAAAAAPPARPTPPMVVASVPAPQASPTAVGVKASQPTAVAAAPSAKPTPPDAVATAAPARPGPPPVVAGLPAPQAPPMAAGVKAPQPAAAAAAPSAKPTPPTAVAAAAPARPGPPPVVASGPAPQAPPTAAGVKAPQTAAVAAAPPAKPTPPTIVAIAPAAPTAPKVETRPSPLQTRTRTSVQILSAPTAAEAARALTNLKSRFGDETAGLKTDVVAVQTGGKTRHRAIVSGFKAPGDATRFCQTLQAAGRKCFARDDDGRAAGERAPAP